MSAIVKDRLEYIDYEIESKLRAYNQFIKEAEEYAKKETTQAAARSWGSFGRRCLDTNWAQHCYLKAEEVALELDRLAEQKRLLLDILQREEAVTPSAEALAHGLLLSRTVTDFKQACADLRRLPSLKKHDVERANLTGCTLALKVTLQRMGYTPEQIAGFRGK